MGVPAAENVPGHTDPGVRRVDHLQTGVRSNAERDPRSRRIWLYVPGGPGRNYYDLVFAWLILTVFAASGGAALTTVEAWIQRR